MNNDYIPNTSAIPNILFDYWMDKLSPGEFKVLMCIARKTYGWHKDFDCISIKQIEKMTGLSRFGITKILDSLIVHGLLIKIKSKTSDGDDAPNRYTIDVNCVGGGSQLNRLQVVNSVDQGVVNSVDPQKKDYTKENLQENTPPSPSRGDSANASCASEKKSKIEISQEAKDLFPLFIKVIHDFEPEYIPPKNTRPMLEAIEKMLKDGRKPGQILRVLEWGVNNNVIEGNWSGWSSKILGSKNPAEYLRERFQGISTASKAKQARKFSPSSNDETALETMKKMSERAL